MPRRVYLVNPENPRRRRRRASEWSKLVKQFGVKGAKKVYHRRKREENPYVHRYRRGKYTVRAHHVPKTATKFWRKAPRKRRVKGITKRRKVGRKRKVGRPKKVVYKRRKKGYEENPRRSRRRRVRREYNENRRRRRARRGYKENPRRRRKGKEDYENNPASILSLPKWRSYKADPMKGAVVTTLGIVDTSLIGYGVDYALRQVKFFKNKEMALDGIRIASKFGIGSLVSIGVSHIARSGEVGRQHQLGVYISTIADGVGTVAKYVIRKIKGIASESLMPQLPMSGLGNIALNTFGMGQIAQAFGEYKVWNAIGNGQGIVIGQDEGTGEIALLNGQSGEVLMKGDAVSIGEIINTIGQAKIESSSVQGGSRAPVTGEDITIEG